MWLSAIPTVSHQRNRCVVFWRHMMLLYLRPVWLLLNSCEPSEVHHTLLGPERRESSPDKNRRWQWSPMGVGGLKNTNWPSQMLCIALATNPMTQPGRRTCALGLW